MVRLISWIEAENIMMGFDFPSLMVFVKFLIHISAGSVKRKGLAIDSINDKSVPHQKVTFQIANSFSVLCVLKHQIFQDFSVIGIFISQVL